MANSPLTEVMIYLEEEYQQPVAAEANLSTSLQMLAVKRSAFDIIVIGVLLVTAIKSYPTQWWVALEIQRNLLNRSCIQ